MTNTEYDRFTAFMDKLIRVPHSTIKRGITVHRKKAAENPNRPGPKPKKKRKAVKPSAGGRASRDRV